MIPLICEFCHQAAAIGDAVIFGPPLTGEELTRLAERHLRGESELVALHPQCDALLDDRDDEQGGGGNHVR